MNQTGTDLPLSPFPVSLPSYRPDTPTNLVVDIDILATENPSSSTGGNQVGEEFSSAGEQMYEGNFDDYRNSETSFVPPEPSHFFCGNPGE